MRVLGQIKYTVEAEGSEVGGKRLEGDYKIEVLSQSQPLKTDIQLAKDDANIVVALGGITTVNFLHVKAVFANDYNESDANIELLINDGAGERTMTGTEFLLVNTDLTSIKLTNNSHDTTGETATIFIDLTGV